MSEAEAKTAAAAAAETPSAKPKLLQAHTWVPLVKDYAAQEREGALTFTETAQHPLVPV